MSKGIGQTCAEIIVENQLRTCGRLPRLPLPKTDAERDARADGVVVRSLDEAGWRTAAKVLARRGKPAATVSEDRVGKIVQRQVAVAGKPDVAEKRIEEVAAMQLRNCGRPIARADSG